jgi:hypothetical protein
MKLRLSHSSIQDFLRCSRRWYLSWIERISAVGESARPLDFGTAFHKGQESWWTGSGDQNERLAAAIEAFGAAAGPLGWEDRVLGPELLTGYAAYYGDDELRVMSVPIAERKVILPVLDPDGNADPDLEYTVVFDVVGYDRDGRTVLVEHKTTASGIDTATFWRRFETSLQLPLQTLAAIDCGRAPSKLVLDAVRAPKLSRHGATPIEKRQFRQRDDKWGRKGDPLPNTRLRDETREEFADRVRSGLLDAPEQYFARREYSFDDHSLSMARFDLWSVGRQMLDVVRREGATPRNPDGCEKYGGICGFEPACWRGESLSDPKLYQLRVKR